MNNRRANPMLLALNIVGFLVTVIVNALANVLPLNGQTTAQVSDRYASLFVPAGVTFAIWGVIYLLLAVLVIYHAVAYWRRDPQVLAAFDRIGYLFFISSLLNAGWIFAWHYEVLPLTLVLMLLLLGSLVAIYVRLGIGRADVPTRVKYAVHLPFSVYLGWITIATLANMAAVIVDLQITGLGPTDQPWVLVFIILGILIALFMLATRRDIFFALVADWALLGILLKRLGDNSVPDGAVVTTAIVGLALVTLGIIYRLVTRRTY